MNATLLLEQINRKGILTAEDLEKQAGSASNLIRQSVALLLQSKDIFLCRFVHAKPTLLSRDFYRCLRTVYIPMPPSDEAQDLLDWLSDNEGATAQAIEESRPADSSDFEEAMAELQQLLLIVPEKINPKMLVEYRQGKGFSNHNDDYLWVTSDDWIQGIPKSSKHNNLAFCMSEIRRFLKPYFTTQQIEHILYSYE